MCILNNCETTNIYLPPILGDLSVTRRTLNPEITRGFPSFLRVNTERVHLNRSQFLPSISVPGLNIHNLSHVSESKAQTPRKILASMEGISFIWTCVHVSRLELCALSEQIFSITFLNLRCKIYPLRYSLDQQRNGNHDETDLEYNVTDQTLSSYVFLTVRAD
jgi:hypothetical protein